MPYPTQALETLLWSSIVGNQHADLFEASQELKDRVGDDFARFEDRLHEVMPDFDIVDDCTKQASPHEAGLRSVRNRHPPGLLILAMVRIGQRGHRLPLMTRAMFRVLVLGMTL